MDIKVVKVNCELDQVLINHLESFGFGHLLTESSIMGEGSHWKIFKKLSNTFECICNDRCPQISITYYNASIVKNGEVMHTSENYEMALEAQADISGDTNSWARIRLNLDRVDLMENVDVLIDRVTKAWEALHG